MPGNAYWARRAEARMDSYLHSTESALETIRKAHDKASRDLQSEANRLLNKYVDNYDLSMDQAKAMLSQPATREEYLRLLEQIAGIPDAAIRREMQAKASSGAYSYRINRLEAMKNAVDVQAARLRAIEQSVMNKLFPVTIQDAFYKTVFDIQKGTGYAFSFNGISASAMQEIMRNPWSGEHFSSRIWKNTNALAQALNETITASFMSGRSYASTAEEIAQRMGVSFREAERLVHTETCYMANAAEMQSYGACGIERYQFLATLDTLTSDVCQSLDGQIFFVRDAMAGVNMPPMHPRCRSTTVVVLDGMTRENLRRGAIDPATGEVVLVPRDMTYPQWYEEYVA